ncbi:MAG TPA: hypothetical protein VJT32_09190 [bacterium]|nr:hypothetical protein [bacterium]
MMITLGIPTVGWGQTVSVPNPPPDVAVEDFPQACQEQYALKHDPVRYPQFACLMIANNMGVDLLVELRFLGGPYNGTVIRSGTRVVMMNLPPATWQMKIGWIEPNLVYHPIQTRYVVLAAGDLAIESLGH